MIDLGTIKCQGMHPGDITEEIISRIVSKSIPLYAMAQVTLDGLSREHGKGIDIKDLAAVREQLLELKIRTKSDEEEKPVPLQQDIRMIDYLKEFETFIGKQQLVCKTEGIRCIPRAGGPAVRDGRAPGDGGMSGVPGLGWDHDPSIRNSVPVKSIRVNLSLLLGK